MMPAGLITLLYESLRRNSYSLTLEAPDEIAWVDGLSLTLLLAGTLR